MTTLDALRASFPAEGLFADKDWLLSPEPLALEAKTVAELEGIGHRLRVFLQAANGLYHRSVKGTVPPWIAALLDAGKPASLLEIARAKPLREAIPSVLRPDLILTEDGLALSEIDSVPGGIGLTAWLNRTYAENGNWDVLGGADGMLEGFRGIFPAETGVDLVVSQEAASYRPEMEWLARELGGDFRVAEAETYAGDAARVVYRFFELFDLPNVPAAAELLQKVASGEVRMTAPPKPWLEEKLWLALFWLRPLRELWRRELSENQQRRLEQIIPYGWMVDPTPLPPHAVLPRLGAQSWTEVAQFSQKERQLVLKLSGFNERAWGARSVTIGHDVPQTEWAAALAEATASFGTSPWVLQEFKTARVIEHPYFDAATGSVKTMRGRVRLCPYYFIPDASQPAAAGKKQPDVRLAGVLATICPEDKKILHGMKDAILVPCRRGEN